MAERTQDETKSINSLTSEALADVVAGLGLPAFRAGQIFGWLHQKQVTSFEEMTNLPAALRQQLAAQWTIDAPRVAAEQHSRDGTRKYLLELADGNAVEAVLMQYKHGSSLCLSSQVGCRMGCRFCASTKGGLVRNLRAGEMAGEVYTVQRATGQRVSHLVLMGIGEPLDNFDNVMDFLAIITDPAGMDLSMRNISLSTCGVVPAIQKLAERRLGLTLSVSLHAAGNEARSALMPVNNAWPLEELLAAAREYQAKTGRRISYEYALTAGVNDSPKDAERLAALLRGSGAHVNLIPLNPVDGSPYGASEKAAVEAFQKRLGSLGINATVRRRLGSDIDAACGQLRGRYAPSVGFAEQNNRSPHAATSERSEERSSARTK